MLGQQTGPGLVTNTEPFASSPCHSPSALTEDVSMSHACSGGLQGASVSLVLRE